jgi:hypothetical protein
MNGIHVKAATATAHDEAVMLAAEDIANRSFHCAFRDLPSKKACFEVWQEAERSVRESEPTCVSAGGK